MKAQAPLPAFERNKSPRVSGRLVACLIAVACVARADAPGTIHYPDLYAYPAYGLRVDFDSAGHKLLEFNTAIGNFGEGPLELFPQNNPATSTTDAYQRLYTHDTLGNWYPAATNYVGTFAFHVEHDHWHLGNFASYELRNIGPNGSIGPNVLARSEKVSFCLRDDWQETRMSFEHTTGQTYTNCSQGDVQGIAVSWVDIYAWSLEGQNLDITGLPDGTYWVLITTNPSGAIAEGGAVNANNVSATKFQLYKRTRIRILQYGQ